ncbi:MAG: TRAP transporter substrate-binding protein DctP [Alphaproteobacteria bacterium]|nr:TRAP transporter substrate-binding protein DctP [Alphaproteobacteria bacterium]
MNILQKRLLASATALGLVAVGLGAASDASAKTIWNFSIWGGKRAVTAGIESIKPSLEKAGGGDFELKIHYADALGPRKQNPENVKVGAFEAGMMCVGYYPNKYPLLSVMELPFLAPRDLHVRAAVEADVLAQADIVAETKKRWNARYFGPAFLPAYEFMGNKRIRSVEDMKGVKMRISGLNAKALMTFGGVPTMVTAPEGYTALQRGTIDSFGFPYSYAFGAYKLYEVSKYVTEGIGMSGFMCFQTVNLDAWNATPQKVRDALPAAQKKATAAMIDAYLTADKKWRPIFREKLTVDVLDPSVRVKLAAGAGVIWEEWVKTHEAKGRPARKMLEFVKASVAKHSK